MGLWTKTMECRPGSAGSSAQSTRRVAVTRDWRECSFLVGEKYADSSAGALSPVCFGLRRDRWRCGSDACAHHNGLYTVYDREYYLAPDAIQFVRPGLNISIQSAQIGSDGTISTDFQIITDV